MIPPEAAQLPNESRRFWHDVTTALLQTRLAQATKLKQALEERQRDKAAQRQAASEEWQPRFFTGALTPVGRPDLTPDGRTALDGLAKDDYRLEESKVYGA